MEIVPAVIDKEAQQTTETHTDAHERQNCLFMLRYAKRDSASIRIARA